MEVQYEDNEAKFSIKLSPNELEKILTFIFHLLSKEENHDKR